MSMSASSGGFPDSSLETYVRSTINNEEKMIVMPTKTWDGVDE